VLKRFTLGENKILKKKLTYDNDKTKGKEKSNEDIKKTERFWND
jgi:hypothetical protein